ncbi:atofp18 ofp18 [Musa troglodytarum]|nr:atofp18 ofp18 [Musa troglodytarum]
MVEAAAVGAVPFEGSIAMAVESDDPYRDFKQSMEEMLTAHGVVDWAWLEELLVWYLRANGKKTHELIIGAFVDLLVSLAAASSSSPPSSSDSS